MWNLVQAERQKICINSHRPHWAHWLLMRLEDHYRQFGCRSLLIRCHLRTRCQTKSSQGVLDLFDTISMVPLLITFFQLSLFALSNLIVLFALSFIPLYFMKPLLFRSFNFHPFVKLNYYSKAYFLSGC